jgi:hypothetical protein
VTTHRRPSAWADAQREFHLAYDEDPTPFPRQPVTVAWTTRGDLDPVPAPDPLWEGAPASLDRRGPRAAAVGPFIGLPHVFGGFLWRIVAGFRYGAIPHDGIEVTATQEGGSRSVAFTVADEPAPLRRKGTTSGTLIGELGTNAVCCLDVDGQILWPTMPPVERPSER